jgi:hypothetical protein
MLNDARDLDIATDAALECVLWSEYDESEVPLDANWDIHEFDWASRNRMEQWLTEFTSNALAEGLAIHGIDPTQFGHDFVLTANHHGAGFWDRGYGALGDRLTELTHGYNMEVFVNDNHVEIH